MNIDIDKGADPTEAAIASLTTHSPYHGDIFLSRIKEIDRTHGEDLADATTDLTALAISHDFTPDEEATIIHNAHLAILYHIAATHPSTSSAINSLIEEIR